MKKMILAFLFVSAAVMAAVSFAQYQEDKAFNACMIHNQQYDFDTNRDCQKIIEKGRFE